MLIEMLVQLLFEIGFHGISEPFKRKPSVFFALVGYAMLGAISGGISVLVFGDLIIKSIEARYINLIVTPVIAGFVMSALGRFKKKRGREVIRLDKWQFGFVFAFFMALVRFKALG